MFDGEGVDARALVSSIASRMKARNLEWSKSRPWTLALQKSVKESLEQQEKQVSEVIYSDSLAETSEFLLDIVAWERKTTERLSLAIECEWTQTTRAVEEDFWKLLVVKAPVKLMIFACNRKPTVFKQEAVWATLSECLRKYRDHIAGEQYIFMDYAPSPSRMAWWLTIPANGPLREVPKPTFFEFE